MGLCLFGAVLNRPGGRLLAAVTIILVGLFGTGPTAAQPVPYLLPDLYVTATRLGAGIAGTSTSVITAEDIRRSPHESLQDLIAREAGVQTWSTFGAVAGARTVVDLRGFGAAAPSNTLVLINGRRLTDVDLAGVDFTAIPRDSIERIEITRGNSGAVLYGDNAVGGVINIITKNTAGLPPSARFEGGFGSWRQREANGSANASSGAFTAAVYANAINSGGYRINNELTQRNGAGDFRYATPQGSVYLNLSADDQHLGLPGARRVDARTGQNQLVTDRKGATTPFDFADKQGLNATIGVTRNLANGTELVVDGGVRQKYQQAAAMLAGAENYIDTSLTTWSVTPRLTNQHNLFGMPSKVVAGLDFYEASYESDRSQRKGSAPIHRYDLGQRTLGTYAQETIALLPTTDIAFGMRVERTTVSARDRFDPNAPGAFFPFDLEGLPLDRSENNRARHMGVEHRFNEAFAVFARAARSFRTPNVDERIAMVPSFSGTPTTFSLRTQTSRDVEGGVRVHLGMLDAQWSMYDMKLQNEVHFSPETFTNTNLDPTRRRGHETSVKLRLSESVRLTGNLAHTRAVFREGRFAGKDVPLVSRWTGSVGVFWNILDERLVFDAIVRYVGSRRMDNDQVNLQPLIPAFTVVDVRLGGQLDRFFWSLAVQNLFDEKYFDYAVASPFPFGFQSTIGTYNAYPQPGRSYMLRAGLKL
jgi:iron complex outermembrane receptor protein